VRRTRKAPSLSLHSSLLVCYMVIERRKLTRRRSGVAERMGDIAVAGVNPDA